jgi:hypothetical protein
VTVGVRPEDMEVVEELGADAYVLHLAPADAHVRIEF